jgi:LPXTG-motif cell wall-anchored protein
VSVTTDGGTASLAEVFSVAVPPPTLGEIDVVSGRRGKTLSVVITGTDLDGVTLVSFGDGIAVNSVQVDSPTQITVEITIDKDAEVGPRDVSVTTAGGTESLPDGFSVEKTDDSISPWWWIGLALILLLMGILFYMLWRKRRKQAGQAA